MRIKNSTKAVVHWFVCRSIVSYAVIPAGAEVCSQLDLCQNLKVVSISHSVSDAQAYLAVDLDAT